MAWATVLGLQEVLETLCAPRGSLGARSAACSVAQSLGSSPEASGAQLTSCTAACRQGAAAQAVQIPKQAPEGSRWGPLDSLEHTDFSQLAAWKPS